MALKRNDHNPTAGKERHIRDHRQVICVHIDLELRLKIKAVLMQEPRVERIVARHAFYLRRIEQ